MSEQQTVITDLGLIKVHSVGMRDTVFLAHNNERAFEVTCFKNEPSRVKVAKRFYQYDEAQWEKIFACYLKWKRRQLPEFRLPNHSGRVQDGTTHPWRKTLKKLDTPDES